MDCKENDMYEAKVLSTGSHKIFRYIKAYGEKNFKAYFNILHEMNEINICHLDFSCHLSFSTIVWPYRIIMNDIHTLLCWLHGFQQGENVC